MKASFYCDIAMIVQEATWSNIHSLNLLVHSTDFFILYDYRSSCKN